MSTTIDIPGGSAVIRDALVTERQYRVIESAMIAASSGIAKGADLADLPEDATDDDRAQRAQAVLAIPHTLDESAALLVIRDARIVAFTESWTLVDGSGKPRPLPTLETVLDLDRELYAALAEATKDQRVDLRAPDTRPNPDPSSPTNGSSSSAGPLRDSSGPEPAPTTSSSESGENTATGASTPA